MPPCPQISNNSNDLLRYLADVDPTGLVNGDVPTWNDTTQKFEMQTPGGGGTVTSVGVLSTTLTVTNSPITSNGNITIELPNTVTLQGNTFNGANQLLQLDATGKVSSSLLPAIAITETFVVSSQSAMLALSAQTGDIAVRTDINTTFILQGSDPTILANWTVLLVPGSGGTVTSVAISGSEFSIGGSPITSSGTITLSLGANAVTLAKIQQFPTGIILGRSSVGIGNAETITIGSGLSLSGGVLASTATAFTGVTIPHTFTIGGDIAVASGDTNFICPFYIPVPTGKEVIFLGARHSINSGTSVNISIRKNLTPFASYSSVNVTTTPTTTAPATGTVANDDRIDILVNSVSGSPKNLSVTLYFRYEDL